MRTQYTDKPAGHVTPLNLLVVIFTAFSAAIALAVLLPR
jgi:hypothetical protein